jgi:hypothetical protein
VPALVAYALAVTALACVLQVSLHDDGARASQATRIAFAAWVLLLAASPVVAGLAHLLSAWSASLLELARGRARGPRRILPSDELERVDGPPPARITGVVRAIEAFESPLSRAPCVATRLVGEGPLGPIDDVAAAPFEVETEAGERVRVSPERARFELALEAAPRAVRPDRALEAFLEARGVFPRRGVVALAEALLVEGERVEVEGHLAEVRGESARALHYREHESKRLLSARSGVPLVIRRLRGDGPARAR